jgi:hypothetical protein
VSRSIDRRLDPGPPEMSCQGFGVRHVAADDLAASVLHDVEQGAARARGCLRDFDRFGIEWQPPQHLLDISRDRRLLHQRSSPRPREA